MRTRRRTGSYAVGRARRDAIIDAATAHFMRAGYAETPMAQIAEDVGLTHRGLLHHFATKKHLLLAVAGRRFDYVHEWIADVPSTPDGLRALRALLDLTSRWHAQPGLIELFVLVTAEAADRSSPARALYVEQYERAVGDMTEDLRLGAEMGQLRPDVDYETVARRCIAMCDGLQLQWVLSDGTLDLVGVLREYLEELGAELRIDGTRIDLNGRT
jgi:AcrR family transcriptional regulator